MDWLADNLWQTWLGLAIVLGVAEMFSLDLILIMVAAGAVAGMIVALVGAPFAAQALVAAGASVAMLALVRPQLVRRFHGGPELNLGHGKLLIRTQDAAEGKIHISQKPPLFDYPGRFLHMLPAEQNGLIGKSAGETKTGGDRLIILQDRLQLLPHPAAITFC